MNFRATASAAILAVIGAMFANVPASAAATSPAVRLVGELVHVADQQGADFAAIRLNDNSLVPVNGLSVKRITSGSALTLDVVIPARVRIAAAANRTLTTHGADGKDTSVPLRASDLAAASDATPESLSSAIGKATVAEAMAPGTPPLQVSKVVTAAADPVSTFTPATRQIYVAVVTPAGATPQPNVDESRIRAQVDGASSYWSDVTGGDLTLNVAAYEGQYTSKYTCAEPWEMWNEAAARAGFTGAPNTSLVIELPLGISQSPGSGCGYGVGTTGSGPNGWGALYVADDVWPILAHELGHNMSMKHADALLCPTAADSAYSTTTSGWTGTSCTEDSYGDGQDIMSMSAPDFAPFLSAPQSLRTGILPPSAATVIDAAGTQSVTLLPLADRTGVRAAEVVNPATGITYYVEYRTAAGRDLRNVYGAQTGVRVLRYNPDTGDTVLLDPSPNGESHDLDPTLPVGQTFTSYDGAVRVTTTSASSTNAVISVAIAPSLTAPAAPTSVLATAGNAQAAVSWTTPASDGGSAITGYTVTATPGGKTATTTGATTATVTGLANGTAYTFTVTATNGVGDSTPSAASNAVTPATVRPSVIRFAGTDRFATSAAIALANYLPGVPVVYIATGLDFPDALAGGAAAAKAGGPLLLVRPDLIPTQIATELTRLTPAAIVVLGGTGAVSAAVMTTLQTYTSGSVTRVSGADRYATAANLAASFPTGSPVFIATGRDFPDALAGTAAAAAQHAAILLTSPTSLPSGTATALSALAPSSITILGGTGAVSAAVETQLGAYTPTVTRLSGSDRYATAAAIATSAFPSATGVFITTGAGFADALTGGPVAGSAGQPLLLATLTCLPAATAAVVAADAPTTVTLLGGTGVLGAGVASLTTCTSR